jgi:small conductance mechanosensitive channel
MVFGIGYGDDLLKAKQILTDIVTNHPKVLAEPEAVIRVSELADSSVNFDVRPWVNAGDYWPVRAELIEQVKLSFDENGVSIPFPQMDVHVNKLES